MYSNADNANRLFQEAADARKAEEEEALKRGELIVYGKKTLNAVKSENRNRLESGEIDANKLRDVVVDGDRYAYDAEYRDEMNKIVFNAVDEEGTRDFEAEKGRDKGEKDAGKPEISADEMVRNAVEESYKSRDAKEIIEEEIAKLNVLTSEKDVLIQEKIAELNSEENGEFSGFVGRKAGLREKAASNPISEREYQELKAEKAELLRKEEELRKDFRDKNQELQRKLGVVVEVDKMRAGKSVSEIKEKLQRELEAIDREIEGRNDGFVGTKTGLREKAEFNPRSESEKIFREATREREEILRKIRAIEEYEGIVGVTETVSEEGTEERTEERIDKTGENEEKTEAKSAVSDGEGGRNVDMVEDESDSGSDEKTAPKGSQEVENDENKEDMWDPELRGSIENEVSEVTEVDGGMEEDDNWGDMWDPELRGDIENEASNGNDDEFIRKISEAVDQAIEGGEFNPRREELEKSVFEKIRGKAKKAWKEAKGLIIATVVAGLLATGGAAGLVHVEKLARESNVNNNVIETVVKSNEMGGELQKPVFLDSYGGAGNKLAEVKNVDAGEAKLKVEDFGEKISQTYVEANDPTKMVGENQYWVLKDGGIVGNTMKEKEENLCDKIEKSWDYAGLFATVGGVNGMGGTKVDQIIGQVGKVVEAKNDGFRYQVANTVREGVNEAKMLKFAPTDGIFLSEFYDRNYETDEINFRESTGDIARRIRERGADYQEGNYLDITEAVGDEWKDNICKMLGVTREEVERKGGRFAIREKCGQVGIFYGAEKYVEEAAESVATPAPIVTPEPTAAPEVTPAPIVTPEPTAAPEVTPAPVVTPEPVITPEPTIAPKNVEAERDVVFGQVGEVEDMEGGQEIEMQTNPITSEPETPNYTTGTTAAVTPEEEAQGIVITEGNGEQVPTETRSQNAAEAQEKANREQSNQSDYEMTEEEMEKFLGNIVERW